MLMSSRKDKHGTMSPKPIGPPFLLQLPRELRQNILKYAFADALSSDVETNILLATLRILMINLDAEGPLVAPQISSCATTLGGIHPVISEDLSFVLDHQLKLLEKRLACLRHSGFLQRAGTFKRNSQRDLWEKKVAEPGASPLVLRFDYLKRAGFTASVNRVAFWVKYIRNQPWGHRGRVMGQIYGDGWDQESSKKE